MAIDEGLYYRLDAIMSRNAVYNFIVGGRGIGKTFSVKEFMIGDYIKNGNQFILLRRYRGELSTRTTFFDDVVFKFEGFGFRVHGMDFQMTRNPHDDKPRWETMGFAIALSTSGQKKSVAYPRVKTIMFDEFIIEKGVVQYLKDEARVMNDFYSTVDRYKEKTRVFFLANSIGIMNPYFIEYGIEPTREWNRYGGGFICAHFPDDAEFVSAVNETRFGKFIEGTAYADYAVGNQFKDNGKNLICKKPSDARYYATVETAQGTLALWRDASDGRKWYAQEKRPRVETKFTMIPENVDETTTLLEYGDKLLSFWRTAFKRGFIMFDKPKSRNAFAQIFKR